MAHGQDLFLLTRVGNADDYNDDFKAGNPGANRLIHDSFDRVRLENRSNIAIIPTREMGDTADTSFITPSGNLGMGVDFVGQGPQVFTSPSSDPLVINCTLLMGVSYFIKRYDLITANDL